MQTEQLEEQLVGDHIDDQAASPGEVLRQERLRRNLSEKEVADRLHITMHFVKAIESDNYEKLPGAVFAKGYIKSYADLLKLEANSLLQLYAEYVNHQSKKENEKNLIRERRYRYKKPQWIVLCVISFVVGFMSLWVYFMLISDSETVLAPSVRPGSQPDQEMSLGITQDLSSQEPLIDASNAAALSEENIVVSDTGAQTQETNVSDSSDLDFLAVVSELAINSAPNNDAAVMSQNQEVVASADRVIEVFAAGSDVLRITFLGESWVEVNDEAQSQIYRDIRSAGDIVEITGNAPFNILLGDALFTNLTFNGIEIDVSNNIRIDNSARLTVGL